MSSSKLAQAAKNGFAMYGSLAKELMARHDREIVYEAARETSI
jgi:hypothetical protein